MNPYAIIIGFKEWFDSNLETLKECFTPVVQKEFDTMEDFAVEIFFELKELP